ncbi:MAG: serine protease [Myxococcales bacterium]|nr:serine protease [Myxococcales bacterium]
MAMRLCALLAVLVLAAGWGCGDARRAAARPTVLRIQTTWTNGPGETRHSPLGSGFVISSEGHVLTAQHVIENGRARRGAGAQERLTAAIPSDALAGEGEANRVVELSVVFEEPALDLAVLQIAADELAPRAPAGVRPAIDAQLIARLSLEVAKVGAPVALSGYPGGRQMPSTIAGRLLDERILSAFQVYREPAPGWIAQLLARGVYLADLRTEFGYSGGPVFLEASGAVIGLCVSVLALSDTENRAEGPLPDPLGTGATLVIPAREIAKALDAHGIPWLASG